MLKKIKDLCNRGHCTCFPDGFWKWYWGECCKKHDDAYEKQDKSKEVGDEELAECVVKKTLRNWFGHGIAGVMWVGVRVGGYKTSWNKIKEEKKNV